MEGVGGSWRELYRGERGRVGKEKKGKGKEREKKLKVKKEKKGLREEEEPLSH